MNNQFVGFDEYGFRHLLAHLAKRGYFEESRKLLLNFNWLQSKLDSTKVDDLITDYDIVLEPLEDDAVLRLVRGALLLSSYTLGNDNTQLASQLSGRLVSASYVEIQGMIREIVAASISNLWLRPVNKGLLSPDGVLLRKFNAHDRVIHTIAIAKDGRLFATGSDDMTVRVWSLQGNAEVFCLRGHTNSVTSIAVAPNGKFLASASWDRTIKIWDLNNGQEIITFHGHTERINSVAISPDSQYLVSASGNPRSSIESSLYIWEIASGRIMQKLPSDVLRKTKIRHGGHTEMVTGVAFTPDGQRIVSASFDKTLKVWDFRNGDLIITLLGHRAPISYLELTKDGRYAISKSNYLLDSTSKAEDQEIRIWDLEKLIEIPGIMTAEDLVESIAITPDNQYVITGSDHIKLLGFKDGKCILSMTSENFVRAIAVTPDNKYFITSSSPRLAVSSSLVKIWNLRKTIEEYDGDHNSQVNSIMVSPDSRFAACLNTNNSIQIWDLENRLEAETIRLTENSVPVKLISFDKDCLITVENGTLKRRNFNNRKELDSIFITKQQDWKLSPDGTYLLNIHSNGEMVDVWNTKSGVCLFSDKLPLLVHVEVITNTGVIIGYSITADGNFGGSIFIWDIQTSSIRELNILSEKGNKVERIVCSLYGERLIFGFQKTQYSPPSYKVWDIKTGQQLPSLSTEYLGTLTITPNGQYVIKSFAKQHPRALVHIDSGPDSKDYSLKIFNLETGEFSFSLEGHTDEILFAQPTPDSHYLVSFSVDMTIRLWDVKERKLLSTFSADDPIVTCAFTSSCKTILVSTRLGATHFLSLEGETLIEMSLAESFLPF